MELSLCKVRHFDFQLSNKDSPKKIQVHQYQPWLLPLDMDMLSSNFSPAVS